MIKISMVIVLLFCNVMGSVVKIYLLILNFFCLSFIIIFCYCESFVEGWLIEVVWFG